MDHLLLAGVGDLAFKAVAFVFLIGVLVIIHEWGHYIMSKRAGVPVEEFSIGFGPVIARLGQQDETTFNLRALPMGGYVRTVGMEPGDETAGGYNMQPIWTRVKIISAGAIINLIFGFLIIVGLGVTAGLPSEHDVKVGVETVSAGSAAATAGLKPGDTFVSINGQHVTDPIMLADAIRHSPNKPVHIVVRRDGGTVPITATPALKKEGGESFGQLGFAMSEDYIWVRHSLGGSLYAGAQRSVDWAAKILQSITSKQTYVKRELGGPIAIAQAAGGYAEKGLKYYMFFMAIFSINLGVLNLLPLPVLDGGHLVLLGIEAVRRKRLSVQFVQAFQGVGLVILFFFFMFIMASDIARLVHG